MRIVRQLIGKANLFANKNVEELVDSVYKSWNDYNIFQKESLLKAITDDTIKKSNYGYEVFIDYFSGDRNTYLFLVNGFYCHPDKTLSFNKDLLDEKNGAYVYSVLRHELVHVGQYFLVDNFDKFPERESDIVKLSICLDYKEHPISFCSTAERTGKFLVKFSTEESVNLFYFLSFAEREAYATQYNIYKDKENFIESKCSYFREKYSSSPTNKEIAEIIDEAYHDLYYNIYPSGSYEHRNLVATVMYDLYHVVQYNYDNSYDISILKDTSLKRKALAEYGYTIYGEDPVNNLLHNSCDYNENIPLLSELTIEQQRVNPQLLLRCLLHSKDTVNYIKDEESFLYEIGKRYDNYDDAIKSVLSECYPYYFTEDFER